MHVRYFGEHVTGSDEGDAKDKHVGFDGDKKQSRLDEDDQDRVDTQPPLAVIGPVGPLPEDGGERGDEEPGGGDRVTEVTGEGGGS